jgi:thimet oligopeptidase
MDVARAHQYRDLVLAPGGNIPAADAVKNFLGRAYNSNAFKERLAKSG